MATALILTVWGCRKNDTFQLEIIGNAVSTYDGAALSGVQVQLWEKVLENGSLSNTPVLAASATTDGSGAYRLEFERKNASEYDVRYSGDGLISGSRFINPESVVPGTPRCVNLDIAEGATVITHLFNANPENELDKIEFRFLNATSPCVCCTNTEVILLGTDVDSTRTCSEHAGKWLRYFYGVDRSSGGYSVLDSVLTEPQQTTVIDINY